MDTCLQKYRVFRFVNEISSWIKFYEMIRWQDYLSTIKIITRKQMCDWLQRDANPQPISS